MRRVALVLGVAAIMVVMAASSSTAAQPEFEEGQITPDPDEPMVIGNCGNFQVFDDFVLNFRTELPHETVL